MGKDQFLSILIKQLQNQDPMQPMEDKEFIAQMAQFSSVEQLMNISKQLTAMSQSLGSVSGLIGKEISWINDSDDGSSALESGIVSSIIVKDGVQYAAVGEYAIPLNKIIEIKEAAKEGATPPADQVGPEAGQNADPIPNPDPTVNPQDTNTPGSGGTI
jgi:flagellar basal-body rod modification protein FlgD